MLNGQRGKLAAPAASAMGATDPAEGGPPGRRARLTAFRPRLAWPGALVIAALLLFWCYLRQSQVDAVNADGAGMVLQGWEMAHGNLLLSGWMLADVTFYTFEVPIDGLVAVLHGLNSDAVHITAAIVYTLLVLIAALLAKGSARGTEGVVRAVLAAGIVVAPSLIAGTHVLLLSPDHTGIAVPIMLALLLIDRSSPPDAPSGIQPGGPGARGDRGWEPPMRKVSSPGRYSWVPVAMGVLLVWAQVDDPLATYAAAWPIVLVCAVRAALPLLLRGRPNWYDAGLAVAAAASVEVTKLAVAAIKAAGGYTMHVLNNGDTQQIGKIVPMHVWAAQINATWQNVLILFGANVTGQHGFLLAMGYLHLVGVALGIAGLLAGIASLFRRADRVTQILTIAIGVTLAGGALATQMLVMSGAHEIAVVLPFGAVLAGRTLGPWLVSRRLPRIALMPVLGAVLGGYLAALGYSVAQPAQPAETQALADWLVAHHLTDGLARYWGGSSTTLSSGGRVHVYPVSDLATQPDTWVAKSAWFDPAVSRANFVVAMPGNARDPYSFPENGVRGAFGKPAREYRFGQYIIMVWNKNLLLQVHAPGPAR